MTPGAVGSNLTASQCQVARCAAAAWLEQFDAVPAGLVVAPCP
jgi:hypothetical protein